MKQRFIQSFIDEESRLATPPKGNEPPQPVHKTKTVSVKTLFMGTKQISNKEDIDRLLDELRIKLEAQLEEDVTIRII